MKRRFFLQLLALPALAVLRPHAAPPDPPLRAGLVYSDSVGTIDLSVLQDGDPHTGMSYEA